MTKVMADVGTEKMVLFSTILERYLNDVDKWTLEKILDSLETTNFLKRVITPTDIEIHKTKDRTCN
jgi:hypothetical protein